MPYKDIQKFTTQNRFVIETTKVGGVTVIQTLLAEDDEPPEVPDECPAIPEPGTCFSGSSDDFCGQPLWCLPERFNCPAEIAEGCIDMNGRCYYEYYRTTRISWDPVRKKQICICVYQYVENNCEPYS